MKITAQVMTMTTKATSGKETASGTSLSFNHGLFASENIEISNHAKQLSIELLYVIKKSQDLNALVNFI